MSRDFRMVVLGRIRDYGAPSEDLDRDIILAVQGIDILRLYTKVPPVSTDIGSAFALAEGVLDCHAVDIEAAVRYVAGKRYGRAEICGSSADGECRSTNEAMALCGALLTALINGARRKA